MVKKNVTKYMMVYGVCGKTPLLTSRLSYYTRPAYTTMVYEGTVLPPDNIIYDSSYVLHTLPSNVKCTLIVAVLVLLYYFPYR